MLAAQIRTQRQISVAIAFLAAGAALVATTARLRINAQGPAAAVHLARGGHPGPSRTLRISKHDAFSTLEPSEMPRGCLDCPVSSYLGSTGFRR